MEENKDFLRQDNNYRTLKAFQKAECIFDITYYFAHKFLKNGDRTIDQMIQAARSGKQNLAEGNIDGNTSREMELKLTNVNRAHFMNCCLITKITSVYADWNNGSTMTPAVYRLESFVKPTLILPFIARK